MSCHIAHVRVSMHVPVSVYMHASILPSPCASPTRPLSPENPGSPRPPTVSGGRVLTLLLVPACGVQILPAVVKQELVGRVLSSSSQQGQQAAAIDHPESAQRREEGMSPRGQQGRALPLGTNPSWQQCGGRFKVSPRAVTSLPACQQGTYSPTEPRSHHGSGTLVTQHWVKRTRAHTHTHTHPI